MLQIYIHTSELLYIQQYWIGSLHNTLLLLTLTRNIGIVALLFRIQLLLLFIIIIVLFSFLRFNFCIRLYFHLKFQIIMSNCIPFVHHCISNHYVQLHTICIPLYFESLCPTAMFNKLLIVNK